MPKEREPASMQRTAGCACTATDSRRLKEGDCIVHIILESTCKGADSGCTVTYIVKNDTSSTAMLTALVIGSTRVSLVSNVMPGDQRPVELAAPSGAACTVKPAGAIIAACQGTLAEMVIGDLKVCLLESDSA